MRPQIDAIRAIAALGVTIDVGAGGRRVEPSVIAVDAIAHPGTTVVADIARLPFRSGSAVGVICTGTLEHVPDPVRAVREFARVLAQDGVAHIEAPFMQPYHADPHDYWRFTDEGLALLFSSWEVLELGSHMGSGTGAAWVLIEAVKTPFQRRRFVRRLIHFVMSLLVQALRLVDRSGQAGPAASGFYLRARPPRQG
ncbi:MAG: class I SAM-dependent methyltransferase [Acidimicrobiia bacterium]|nr:class I SAM-dependent methyltransferase [Acidimicrobiia bacterium]